MRCALIIYYYSRFVKNFLCYFFQKQASTDHLTQGNLLKTTLLNEKQSNLEKEMYGYLFILTIFFTWGNILTLIQSLVSTISYFLSFFLPLRKIPSFHLISWCGNFVERHSFLIVSGDSPETMWKLCLSTKFPHQEIR